MLSRSTFSRNAPRALQNQCSAASANRARGMASATTGLNFDTTEAGGVKIANREVASPTGSLMLVAKAGPRYQPFPGFSEALESFAFKTTLKRTALRITREVELLGGEFSATHSREHIALQTKFLENDLPYFTELLAEVASQTKFPEHELNEHVIKLLKYKQEAISANPEAFADDVAHAVAFHRGLGENIVPHADAPIGKYLNVDALAQFAQQAYAKPNISLVATGPSSADVSKWVGEFFKDLPAGASSSPYALKPKTASKYYGGEQRISSKAGKNAVVIAFPGSSAFGTPGYKPEVSVLTALLGGQSTIKWSTGFSLLAQATQGFSHLRVSAKNHAYSDAGLFTVTLSGSAAHVGTACKNVVDTLKKVAAGEVAAEDIKKASALAKFRTLESAQLVDTGLEASGAALVNGGKAYQISEVARAMDKVTEQQVKDAAKSILSGKATYAAVGDLFQIPFAEDLGLNV